MNENSNSTANFFFRSMQGNVFEEFPQAFTSNEITYSYAVARGDLNNGGFYDMHVSRTTAPGNAIYRNSGNANNFIKISLQGIISNRMAIGSRIQVYANGKVFTQYTMCGEGYLSQNSQHHIFGLANINTVDSVIISYPSGVIISILIYRSTILICSLKQLKI